jgi:hypothetical protein
MVALVATPSREFIKLRDAVRASWSVAERKLRAQIALTMQLQLLDLTFADTAEGCSGQQVLDTKRSAIRRF